MKLAGTLGFALLVSVIGSSAGTPPLPVIPTNLFNIVNYGALGDGISNSTFAISNAIAAAAASGGTVEIPSGTYLSGPFNMTNGINLQIDSGAILKMLPITTFTNYVPAGTNYFINAKNLHDIKISGSGTIEGQGTNWWVLVGTPNEIPRPTMIFINGCTRVLVQDVTLQNPPASHLAIKSTSVGVTVQAITVNSPRDSHNTDALDLAATNCLVASCSLSGGDDNIAIGSSGGVSADILVTNCVFGFGHGCSIGSFTSSGVRDLVVSNCTFNNTDNGIRLKSQRGRGGLVKNLKYFDLTMNSVQWPILIYSYYEYGVGTLTGVTPFMASTDTVQVVTNTTPIWRDIIFSNITATTTGTRPAVMMWGLPEMLISNVTLCHVNVSGSKSANIYNAQAIRFIDSQITVPSTTNTFNLYRADITMTNSIPNTNVVTFGGLAVPPTNNALAFFNATAMINETNVLGSGPIALGGSTLSFKQSSVSFSNNLSVASASTLFLAGGTNTLGGALSGSLTIAITNAGTLRLAQGTNVWGGANAVFEAGASGTINNGSTNNITVFLGALTGGAGAKLHGSDQIGIGGVDTYIVGGLNSNTVFAGTITNGTHIVALTKIGSGTFTLLGTNNYSAGTTVSNGTLLINGTITGSVTVVNGATLGGTGKITGPVTLSGTLAPGGNPGTLIISNTLVVSGGVLQYELGTNSDRTVVSGNLTLGGTLNVTDAGGFTNNTFTLFTYGGTLTYSGVNFGSVPAGYSYLIDTGTVGQVKLAALTVFQGWQMQYFGCTNCPQAAGDADADGDGLSNTSEFLAGTNPTNSVSALAIISAVQQGNDVVVTWSTAGGRTNAVQASLGDAAGGYITNFSAVGGLVIINGSGDATTNYVDTGGATNTPARYYRVRFVP